MTYAPSAYICRLYGARPEMAGTSLVVVAASDLERVRRQQSIRWHRHHGVAVRIKCDIRSAEAALTSRARPRPETMKALADAKLRLAAAYEAEGGVA